MIRITAFVLALTLAAGTVAFAQTPAPNNCTADAKRLCADVKPGEGRVIACLVKEKANLTTPCSQLLAEMGKLK
jgi:hypothetical protein